ncbi:MAG: hypothetical protein IT226_02295 [Flavobacteriales bacterium]|nr:hypothetical protein [Flavobacteriales bacterium]
MKTLPFLRRLALFLLIPIAVLLAILFRADGSTDEYYLRFTTPPATSLVLGTSRAAQGIQPHVLDSVLAEAGIHVKTMNYAFAMGLSPYGPTYLNSIRKKLDPAAKDGVFVLAVDPWSLSATRVRGRIEFDESSNFLAKMDLVNMHPNIEYLLTVYPKPLLGILVPDPRANDKRLLLHEDGWLEVSVPMDPASVAHRRTEKLAEYRNERLPNAVPSNARIGALLMTIDLLKPHGRVLLVRLPVSDAMLEMENELMPHFNRLIDLIARHEQVDQLDLSANGDAWTYTDLHHLYTADGARVTAMIARKLGESSSGDRGVVGH